MVICMPRLKKGKLNKKNYDAVEDYMLTVRQNFDKETTRLHHYNIVDRMLRYIDKDFDKITTKDILLFLDNVKPTTAETLKSTIIHFFKHNGMEELANSIPRNVKILTQQTKGEESVLTPQEIEAIIEAPRALMDRALHEIFIVTGARRSEILNLNFGDIKIDPDVIWVNVRVSKTKIRKIPIVPNKDNPAARFPKYLVQWLKYCGDTKPNEPLFTSPRGGRIKKSGIYDKIEWMNQHVKLNVKLTPHIYRHTAATYDGANLNEAMLCEKYGWRLGSNMVGRYCHFSTKQLVAQMIRQAGLKEEEIKQGKTCPRCGETNNINAEVCVKCHQILDYKKLMEEVEEKEHGRGKLAAEIKELREENETLQNNFTILLHRMDELVDKRAEETEKAEISARLNKKME